MNTHKNTSPNIVFIHAESMDGRTMGCMDHPAMQNATPNLDQIAGKSAMFSNAYSICPVCNPSRAGMWSGKYPNYYDCWNNHEGLKNNVPTFQTLLDRAGYRTEAIGPLDYQWGMHSIRDRVGSWTRSAKVYRPLERHPMPVILDESGGGRPYENDWCLVDKAVSFIEESARAEKPFMLYLTTGLVHPPFNGFKKYMDMIDADAIEIPPGAGDGCENIHPVDEYMRITKNCKNPFPDWLVKRMRHIYYAMIAAVDEMVGHVMQSLQEAGVMDETYIIFSSEHGEMAGEHNQILKRSMYEPSIHVPMLISGPAIAPNQHINTPVSLIDIYPTLMDMAGVNLEDYAGSNGFPDSVDGESLLPVISGGSRALRGWAFAEYHGDRNCTGSFMLRKGPWKYIKHIGYQPQLFNVVEDKWEMNDLAAQKPEITEELDELLMSHFDCDAIDARAKKYDKKMFKQWRRKQIKNGNYKEEMACIYSGFDRLCIQDVEPWTEKDEKLIIDWLAS